MIASVCIEGNEDLLADNDSDMNVNNCDEYESQQSVVITVFLRMLYSLVNDCLSQ
jgi:hypothetical protein